MSDEDRRRRDRTRSMAGLAGTALGGAAGAFAPEIYRHLGGKGMPGSGLVQQVTDYLGKKSETTDLIESATEYFMQTGTLECLD